MRNISASETGPRCSPRLDRVFSRETQNQTNPSRISAVVVSSQSPGNKRVSIRSLFAPPPRRGASLSASSTFPQPFPTRSPRASEPRASPPPHVARATRASRPLFHEIRHPSRCLPSAQSASRCPPLSKPCARRRRIASSSSSRNDTSPSTSSSGSSPAVPPPFPSPPGLGRPPSALERRWCDPCACRRPRGRRTVRASLTARSARATSCGGSCRATPPPSARSRWARA